MMDDDKIIEFEPGASVTLKKKKFNTCQHFRVILDEEKRVVECKDCKIIIDPFDHLCSWSSRRMRFHESISDLKNQRQDLNKIIDDLKREERNIKARLKRLKAYSDDSRRIDWIDRNMDCDLSGPGLHVSSVEIGDEETLRQALDRVAAEINRKPL